MATKIIEKILEPSAIYTGSIFKLKIKAIRYATYQEIKNRESYRSNKRFSYSDLKGD